MTQDFLEVHDLVGPSKTKILSTVTAIYDIGCFFGAIIAFTWGERLGRKKAILLGTLIMAIGTIIKASSYSLAQMFVGRIILGYEDITFWHLVSMLMVELVWETALIQQQPLFGRPRQRTTNGEESWSSLKWS